MRDGDGEDTVPRRQSQLRGQHRLPRPREQPRHQLPQRQRRIELLRQGRHLMNREPLHGMAKRPDAVTSVLALDEPSREQRNRLEDFLQRGRQPLRLEPLGVVEHERHAAADEHVIDGREWKRFGRGQGSTPSLQRLWPEHSQLQ
jgi:hypothetical protein